MILRTEIQEIQKWNREKNKHRVLSLCLPADQKDSTNINRGFEVKLKNLLSGLSSQVDPSEKALLEENGKRLKDFVSSMHTKARTVFLYSDAVKNIFWHKEVMIPLEPQALWDESFFIQPLVELWDEYERYGVLLIDRSHARFFIIFLNEIEEMIEFNNDKPVKQYKSPGSDHLLSQKHFERTSELHAFWHRKSVAKRVMKSIKDYDVDRLFVAGPHESAKEAAALLPKKWQEKIESFCAISIHAKLHEVLDKVAEVIPLAERKHENDEIQRLITSAKKEQRAVVGMDSTLEALQQGRIERFFYEAKLKVKGFRCSECHRLFSHFVRACSACGGEVHDANNFVNEILGTAFERGSRVEEVRGYAAEKLRQSGSVGGFLKQSEKR